MVLRGQLAHTLKQKRALAHLSGGKIQFLLKIHKKNQPTYDIKGYVHIIYLYINKTLTEEKLIYCGPRLVVHLEKNSNTF